MGMRRSGRRGPGFWLIGMVALALPLSGGAAVAAPSHAGPGLGAPRVSGGGPVPVRSRIERAAAQARATGKPVLVAGMTTSTSQTSVQPNGSITLNQVLAPVRALRGGQWRNLNPALSRGPSGRVVPAVTASGLTLSGGGSGPLAVLTNGGHTLTVTWPGISLPAPVLSGATAVYVSVLPGVDLQVTADGQGGISTVLVVHDAAAAADPALASLRLALSSPGLAVSANAGGFVSVAASGAVEPLFSALAPRMWDSAPPPAGTPTAAGPGGVAVTVPAGFQADSSAQGPGAFAHVVPVPVSVSGGVVTLSPPAAALTGPGVTYPVYIDPTIYGNPVGANAANWTEVSSGWPNTANGWDQSGLLQVGLCDWVPSCGSSGTFVARSMFNMPVSAALKGATVNSSVVTMTDEVSSSCTPEPIELWTLASAPTSATDWANKPAEVKRAGVTSFAYGYPGGSCATPQKIGFDIKLFMNQNVTCASGCTFKSSIPFEVRAQLEDNDLYWRQFLSGASNITISTNYNLPPLAPTGLSTSPGGSCQTNQTSPAQIGNDDVSFSATVVDQDGDGNLKTRYVVYNSGGTVAYDSGVQGTSVTTGNNAPATMVLKRNVMQGLNPGGGTTAYLYYWQAQTADSQAAPLTGPMTTSKCWFEYNPIAPGSPAVTPQSPISGQVGKTIAVSFGPSQTPCGTGQPVLCPASYTYQLGAGMPVTVAADGNGNWLNGVIPVRRAGPQLLTVYAIDTSGNIGEPASVAVSASAPAPPYGDGDINGDGQPDLLTIGSTASPGLWLSASTGPGKIGPAVDIGGAGTGINTSGSAADWASAMVLHGDFSGSGVLGVGNGVQDVIAYYPASGAGQVIYGNGDGGMLQPYSGNVQSILPAGPLNPYPQLSDPGFASTDAPFNLVAAGNISEAGTGYDDLIGIVGDATSGYELALFTATAPGGYYWQSTLAVAGTSLSPANTSPDGTDDWNNYVLASAQPGGKASATVLFAYNNVSGSLYEAYNPGCPPSTPSAACSTATLAGMRTATGVTPVVNTWVQITGAVPPASPAQLLTSADVNIGGQMELWFTAGGKASSYSVGGSDTAPVLVAESAGMTVSQPPHEWPVSEGSGTTAYDTTGGDNATLTGSSYSWNGNDGAGDSFGPYLDFGGTTQTTGGSLTAARSAVDTSKSFTVSAWVKMDATPQALLPSAYNQAIVAQDGTNNSGFYLAYANSHSRQWGLFFMSNDTQTFTWTSAYSPLATNAGVWTHLVGVYSTTAKTISLYVNGALSATTAMTSSWNATGPLTIGRDKYKGVQTDFLNGSVADVQLWSAALTTAQVDATGGTTGIGPVTSAVAGKCLDDWHGGWADGNVVDIYSCNSTFPQEWTVNPGGTVTAFGKCLDIAGGGTGNGTLIDLSTCTGLPGQVWVPQPDGSLRNPASLKCLDDPGSTTVNGTQLQLYTCDGSAGEKWALP